MTATDDTPDLVGKTLPGGWQVTRHIAEGAMGHVYEASTPQDKADAGTPARVAVKVLHSSLVAKPDVAFRFRHEAELLEAVANAHVPKVFARGRDARGRPFQVLELVDGSDLGKVLQDRSTLPFSVAVSIAVQLCKALAVAHGAGIVHRDLKPENVIVGGTPDDPIVKLLDFSVSKDEDLAFTKTGIILGTPSYMPPEQARGEVTPLVDVYAVGAILYDMLVGRPPFEGDEAGKVLARLLTEVPPTPRSLAPQISIAAEDVILRAIAREPKDRYPSATALMEALDQLQESASRQSLISTIPPAPGDASTTTTATTTMSTGTGTGTASSGAARWVAVLVGLVGLGIVVAITVVLLKLL